MNGILKHIRAIQVKKDGMTYENGADREVMIVSGRIKFDAFGRAKETYYPVTETTGNQSVFNAAFDNIAPTQTEYDVLDRAVKVTLPDGTVSTTQYTKNDADGTLITTVTDGEGGQQATFTNGSGLTVKTEQYSGPDGTITTIFEFDPINQLLKAIDNGGNETVSAYDLAGRRTQVTHPVSGETSFTFDNAGNLLTKRTANLRNEGKAITYDYEFNRLTAITYPNHPENNVKYSYGNKNAPYNRVGRLMLQEDGSGAQEFTYDRLGNIESVRRTLIIPNQAIATYLTQWKYDSWNRIEEMIYPDGEKISYSYNAGGLLESVKGEKAYSYNYVNHLGYDKFEQRIYMKYCNGAETSYSYDEQRRRLSSLSVNSTKTNAQLMNNAYSYDAVDNVLSVTNSATNNSMAHAYDYDGLYRLTRATGTYAGENNKTASYTLDMAYDNLHNITNKKQHVEQQDIQFNGMLKAGYELAYNYTNNPFQISTLGDENYRTDGDVANNLIEKQHAYEYDANGNLIYVNTAREKKDGTQAEKSQERKSLWDEENRLEAIDENGFVSNYWYDAAGERTVKTSGESEQMFVNGIFSGGNTGTANFTAYVNPYIVVSKGGHYTKHIYIGSQRIVSKLGDLDSYGADPRRIEYAGTNVDAALINYKGKYESSQQTIKDRYAIFEVPYLGIDNDDYVNGQGFCCDDTPQGNATKSAMQNDNPELFQYYYHSDHLGSTSLITNLDGEVVQHVEYVPFGEVFIEERNNTWNTPYLFNAKELDEETGLYYYGARYYEPRISLWLSTDPLQEKFPNISTYVYCVNNPVKFIDPDGEAINLAVAAIGAAVGGLIGGGVEIASQLISDGEVSNWRAVAGSAAGGAVTGGMAGFTMGGSLVATSVGIGLATAEGGLVDDLVQGKQSTVESVATDFVVGTTLSAGGKLLANRIGGAANNSSSGVKQATTRPTETAKGGIAPKGWDQKATRKSGGVEFVDPKNPHNRIRQMPGNPNSPNPAQHNPYVVFKKNGVAYDVNGNPLKSATDPAAHIPLEKFDMNKMPTFE